MFTLIPVGAAILGGIVAVYRPPGRRQRSYIQHFAAGVVFAAVTAELLPDLNEQALTAVIIGFILGVGVMLAVRWLSKKVEQRGLGGQSEGATGLIITVGIDVLIDGILIGVAFAAGANEGILITIALTLEILFLGLSVVAAMPETASKIRRIATASGLGVLLLLGAAAGAVVFGGLTGPELALILAFGSAALLYLVTEELLVEAHEVRETAGSTSLFFVGFLSIFIIDMI